LRRSGSLCSLIKLNKVAVSSAIDLLTSPNSL